MGLIPQRHTVNELGWGLNPHPNSSLLPSSFFLLPSSFFLRFKLLPVCSYIDSDKRFTICDFWR
ncbi:MAG: hypothetical protein AAF316_12525 [Cyanobacteria bacterium P01_A01_bin.80]